MGPHVITDISLSGLYFLRDKYSQKLKRPVPPNELVQYYGVGGFCKAKFGTCDDVSSDNSSDVDMNSSLQQTKTNVGVCHDPLSDSFSDVDMNSSHIPHQAQSNISVSDYPLSDSLSDVDINSSNIPKSSYDSSSDSSSDTDVAKSAFQNNCDNDRCQQS